MKIFPDSSYIKKLFGFLLSCLMLSCIPPETIVIAYIQPVTNGGPKIDSFPNTSINKPTSITFLEYQSTFEEIYPNIDVFKQEFVTSIQKLIHLDQKPINLQEKIDIEEICFGKDSKFGLFIPFPSPLAIDFSKNYCFIKITFKIVNATEHTILHGVLVTATSDGHDVFFRKKRVAAAISQAEKKFADLVLGKLPASEMKDITTSQNK